MVPRWRFLRDFASGISAIRVQHISDLHSKFALKPHHVWKYMVDIHLRPLRIGEDKEERRRKKKKEEVTAGVKRNGLPITMGGHDKTKITGTVHTSAKARFTSVPDQDLYRPGFLIRIRIRGPDRHQKITILFTGPLPTFPGNFIQIRSQVSAQLLTDRQTNKHTNKLEMWANAQRDGRPAEHRWRALFNAA